MNRYFLYLVFVNMVANMVASVPKILLKERMDGVILSMLLSIITGMIVVYAFMRFFQLFPGQGLPELMKGYLPKWFTYPYLILTAILWYVAGFITLITYTFLLKRFLTPNMPLIWIVAIILFFISYGVLMKTERVLYTVEIVLLCTIPLILFMIFKAFATKDFEWDFVMEAVMYIQKFPNYNAYTASLYLFLGSANIIIFNRVFSKSHLKNALVLFIVAITGTLILLTTFFVPIGINGFENVETLVYPAVSTADSLRMPYGIIERILYLFLMFFLAITFLSLIIHWHVSMELLKSVFSMKNFTWKNKNLTPYIFLVIFWIVGIVLVMYLTEYQLVIYTGYFFKQLPFIFAFMFLLFLIIKRKAVAMK